MLAAYKATEEILSSEKALEEAHSSMRIEDDDPWLTMPLRFLFPHGIWVALINMLSYNGITATLPEDKSNVPRFIYNRKYRGMDMSVTSTSMSASGLDSYLFRVKLDKDYFDLLYVNGRISFSVNDEIVDIYTISINGGFSFIDIGKDNPLNKGILSAIVSHTSQHNDQALLTDKTVKRNDQAWLIGKTIKN